MTRTNRTPAYILIGLIVIVFILSYNYYAAIKANNDLVKQLNSMAVRVSDATNKKATADKQNEALANRIKYFEERAETNQQAINKKDEEMNEVNNKLNDAQREIEMLKSINSENLNKLV